MTGDTTAGQSGAGGVYGLLRTAEHTFCIPAGALAEVAHISKLHPFLSDHAAVRGAVAMRGLLVPVCDPLTLCDEGRSLQAPRVAAFATDGDRVLSLGVDEVGGLYRCSDGDVQHLGADKPGQTIAGHIRFEDGLGHILDMARLFDTAGLPFARRKTRTPSTKEDAGRTKNLVFEAGGVAFGLSAHVILGTVPRQPIDETWLAAGLLAGCIRYHGHRAPVVEPTALFGLGGKRRNERPEFVVIRLDNGKPLALAVDAVRFMRDVPVQDESSDAGFGTQLLAGTFDDPRGTIAIVSSGRLVRDQRLCDLRDLSDRSDEERRAAGSSRSSPDGARAQGREPNENALAQMTGDTDTKQPTGSQERRVRHVVFRAANRFATPINQIARVLEPPDSLMTLGSAPPGVLGLFMEGGRPVPLVSVPEMLGLPSEVEQECPSHARVLLVEAPNCAVGVLVQSIESISESDWRSQPADRMPGGFDLVRVRNRGTVEVLDVLDLESFAARVGNAWHEANTDSCATGESERSNASMAPARKDEGNVASLET